MSEWIYKTLGSVLRQELVKVLGQHAPADGCFATLMVATAVTWAVLLLLSL